MASERGVDFEADLFVNWRVPCTVCGQTLTVSFKPTRIYESGRGKGIQMMVYDSDLCGPCHWGSASELNWHEEIPLDRHIGLGEEPLDTQQED